MTRVCSLLCYLISHSQKKLSMNLKRVQHDANPKPSATFVGQQNSAGTRLKGSIRDSNRYNIQLYLYIYIYIIYPLPFMCYIVAGIPCFPINFSNMFQTCPSGLVTEAVFKDMYCQFFPLADTTLYAHYVFRVLDKEKTGTITFKVSYIYSYIRYRV